MFLIKLPSRSKLKINLSYKNILKKTIMEDILKCQLSIVFQI